MQTLVLVKLLAAVTIGLMAWFAVRVPIWLSNNKPSPTRMLQAEYFARGIFLATGLIHLLPEAIHHAEGPYAPYHVPLAAGIAIITVIVLLAIEMIARKMDYLNHHHAQKPPIWIVYFVFFMLSLHSLIAGSTLGISEYMAEAVIILVAILAHKSAEAFAFGMTCVSNAVPPKRMRQLAILFSLMTPMGILLGASFNFGHSAVAHAHPLLTVTLHAVGAGTFLYLAGFNHSEFVETGQCLVKPRQMFAFTAGALLMTCMAVLFDF